MTRLSQIGRNPIWPIFIIIIFVGLLSACAETKKRGAPQPQDVRPQLTQTIFSQLPGWNADRHGEALRAFSRSCTRLMKAPDNKKIKSFNKQFLARDWKSLCRAAAGIDKNNHHAARWFFERWFAPHQVTTGNTTSGLFTGYYEAELNGSWRRTKRFHVPLYAKPKDLISADLSQFSPQLKGKRIAGRLRGNKLIPYHSRREIDGGALRGKARELLWVDSATDAFFLHVQGSGRVKMTNGQIVRVGYAAKNGRPYVAIGRVLIKRGAIAKENVSMQSIRAWLAANPHKASALFATNPSYIFFRRLKTTDAVGAMGVGLTPGRSLAVDRRYIPLGAPLWLDTNDPLDGRLALRRLMVAQDTGGAIKGPVRGDVFWGFGPEAAQRAGQMKSRGTYYLLLPKKDCC